MFGGCGSAPRFAANLPTRVKICSSNVSSSSSPSPSPSPRVTELPETPEVPNDGTPRLPRVPVMGDEVPNSLIQIEAVTNAGIADVTAAAAAGSSQPLLAAVMDSGIDANHWDLHYAGGKSFLADDPDAGRDDLGHGM
jgi:hypothetical protein